MTLSTRRLNRALLARQLLLERSRAPIGRALEQIAGLQAQYAPSVYIRPWSSLEGFRLAELTRALERRRAVQGTLMRSTIHVVSPRDYWHFATDGAVAGVWRVERVGERATLRLEPFEPLPRGARRELRDKAGGLIRVVEPDAVSYAVR